MKIVVYKKQHGEHYPCFVNLKPIDKIEAFLSNHCTYQGENHTIKINPMPYNMTNVIKDHHYIIIN
ncbi:hypothetical protein LCGC14_1302610 [marine sediment metagenome]|uniref:Uncharacterized protein n=1 Tax=marine sediment metagenome TaxID=412755 RepID=A0A0F9KQH6_9ZZZZ